MSESLFLESQLLNHLLVTLEDLDGIPSLHVIVHVVDNGFLDMGKCMLNRTGEGMHRNLSSALCGGDGCLCGVLDSDSLEGGDLNDLTTEFSGKLSGIELIPVLAHKIHHVDGNHHRDSEFDELGCEIEVSLEVRAIHDVQDGIGPFAYQIVSGNHLFKSIWREGVDSGKVGDCDVIGLFELTLFLFDCDSGPVSHVLVGTGESIEQGCLSAVGVSR